VEVLSYVEACSLRRSFPAPGMRRGNVYPRTIQSPGADMFLIDRIFTHQNAA